MIKTWLTGQSTVIDPAVVGFTDTDEDTWKLKGEQILLSVLLSVHCLKNCLNTMLWYIHQFAKW